MKLKIQEYTQHWRDVLLVLTVVFVLSSLVLISYSISQANNLAAKNKAHIDCIVKDLATPIPTGAKNRVIVNPLTDCNITFTK